LSLSYVLCSVLVDQTFAENFSVAFPAGNNIDGHEVRDLPKSGNVNISLIVV